MVGITLSPEQIRSAPPQVREWIEHEIAHALGLTASAPQPPQVPPHLVACGHDEVKAILAEIRSMLPVVAVFFELGRELGSRMGQGVRVLRIADILSHSLLHMPAQVVQCLDVINEAMRRVRGDSGATIYALDQGGHCLIAEATAQSILLLWQGMMAPRAVVPGSVHSQSETVSAPGSAYASGLPEQLAVGIPAVRS